MHGSGEPGTKQSARAGQCRSTNEASIVFVATYGWSFCSQAPVEYGNHRWIGDGWRQRIYEGIKGNFLAAGRKKLCGFDIVPGLSEERCCTDKNDKSRQDCFVLGGAMMRALGAGRSACHRLAQAEMPVALKDRATPEQSNRRGPIRAAVRTRHALALWRLAAGVFAVKRWLSTVITAGSVTAGARELIKASRVISLLQAVKNCVASILSLVYRKSDVAPTKMTSHGRIVLFWAAL
jgi:hypothetical protein